MTQDERIRNLEQEVLSLKQELKSTRKANVWKKVKDKYTKELNSFDWIHKHSFTDYEGKLIEHTSNMNESYHISQAIGTIVRVVLKRKGINYFEEKDMYKAEKITKEILEIMKREEEK